MTSGVRNGKARVGGVREEKDMSCDMSRVKTAGRSSASSIATGECVVAIEGVEFHVHSLIVWRACVLC
jgi:hypothetical protein